MPVASTKANDAAEPTANQRRGSGKKATRWPSSGSCTRTHATAAAHTRIIEGRKCIATDHHWSLSNTDTTPNKALSEGSIDVNLFQHLKFLAQYNVGENDTLVPVGSTEIVPLALFWKDHDSLDGIEGQSVVIPSDASNQGRAINVLVQAGLVTLKENGLVTPNPSDIDPAKSKVTVTPVDAAQTPVAYGEGRPAIINNSFLDRAGIDPKSSVFQDDPSSEEAEPYINAFVTREEDQDNDNIAKLVEIWQSPEVTEAVAEDSRGTSVPVKRSKEDLKKILERIENSERN